MLLLDSFSRKQQPALSLHGSEAVHLLQLCRACTADLTFHMHPGSCFVAEQRWLQIATGQMPMRGSILPPDRQQCPQAMNDIIQECMASNPEERPSAKDVFLCVPSCCRPHIHALPPDASQNAAAMMPNLQTILLVAMAKTWPGLCIGMLRW